MAVDRSVSIKVDGLKEFRAALKQLGDEGDAPVKEANFKTASFVVDHAVGRAAGVSRQAAKAATSLRPSRSGVSARVNGGGSIPFFFGAEFGAVRYHQFRPFLGHTGYFLYPTIRDRYDEIIDIYGDEIEKAARIAFPDGGA